MPLALQDAKGDDAAGHVMELNPLRPRLTAAQAEVIRADADHLTTAWQGCWASPV
jgi:hypothetical protein